MKKHLFTAVLTALTMGALTPLSVQAAESDVIHVTVDHCILQPEEVADHREIPLYVSVDMPHPALTSVEFGLELDDRCTFELITSTRKAQEIGGEPLDCKMIWSSNANFIWMIWAVADPIDSIENMALVNVTIPEDADYGDCYMLAYQSQSKQTGSSNIKSHLWLNVDGSDINYNGCMSWDDGYVLIAPKRGDVNLDREVDILDVIMLNKYLLGSQTLGVAGKYAGETNGDDALDSTDSLNVLKYIVDLIDTLEH